MLDRGSLERIEDTYDRVTAAQVIIDGHGFLL